MRLKGSKRRRRHPIDSRSDFFVEQSYGLNERFTGETMQGTRSRILTAAEGLFADRGFSAPSVRMITSRAQINVAAMHYHFGSKDQLISGCSGTV